MRKYCIAILLMIITSLSNAQIKNSSILLGGQLSYYSNKSDIDNFDQKFESGRIGISIGKAIKENSVIGINFTYSPYKQNNVLSGQDTFSTVYNRYDIGAFYRGYKNIGKEFYFFSQVDGAYITGNQKDDYFTSEDVTSTLRGGFASLSVGISYNLFEKMQLELILPNLINMQYLVTKSVSDNSQVPNSKKEEFVVSSNITNSSILGYLGIGFRFIL